jgi:hypothetical protein
VSLQAREVAFTGGEPAAGGDHGFVPVHQFVDDAVFPIAKSKLAVLLKNVADGFSRASLDDFIGIEKREMQRLGDQPTYRGFARAHKANQGKITNLA